MTALFRIHIIAAIVFLVLGFYGLIRKPFVRPGRVDLRVPADAKILCYSKLFPVLAMVLSAAAIAICGYCLANSPSAIAGCLCVVCLLGSAVLLLAFFRYRVRIGPKDFEIRRTIRRTRIFAMRDVVGVEKGPSSSKIVMHDGAVLHLDSMLCGYESFIAQLKRQCKNKHGRNSRRKHSLFRGYVLNPGEFIFIFVLIGIFFLGALGYALFWAIHDAPNAADETQASIVLDDYTAFWDGDDLELHTPQYHQTLHIAELSGGMTAERQSHLRNALENRSPITVFVPCDNFNQRNDAECLYMNIWRIEDLAGSSLLSLNEAVRAYWIGASDILLLLGSLLLLHLLFVWYFCYIVSHAPEHPIAFKLLVMESHRNI